MDEDEDGANINDEPAVIKLQQKLQRAESENLELREQLNCAKADMKAMSEKKEVEDEESGSSLIPHIKVTLI